MAGRKSDFTLTKLDDLFSTQEQRDEEKLSKIRDIPLTEIDDFPDHPFKVRDDEDMAQLIESIKERGVITPATVRQKEDGRYELISGHRRKRACELAGFDTLRCEVVELNRDEATILMVESNYQRSQILPSEKAYWSWYGFDSRVEWCACFVSWCANECGYIDAGIIPKYAGCVNGVQWFRDRGQWADGSYEPSPGTIIFFDWEGDGVTDHTGIVQKCENGTVYTVEGNSGDTCRTKTYPVGSSVIYGYGIPAY